MLIAHVNHIREHTSVSEVSSLPVRDHLQTKLYPVNKFTNTSVSTVSQIGVPQQAAAHIAPKRNQSVGWRWWSNFYAFRCWTRAKTETELRRLSDRREVYPHRSVATSLRSGI